MPKVDVERRFLRSKRNFWLVYKDLADAWRIFYNNEEQKRIKLIAVGAGKIMAVFEQKIFNRFMKGIDDEV